MLKLRNIKKNNGIISAEYDPECSGDTGKISIDVKSGRELEHDIAAMDIDFPIYYNHAIEALRKIKDDTDIPEEKLVMWY